MKGFPFIREADMTISKALLALALPLTCLAQAPIRTLPLSSLKLLRRPAEPSYPLLPQMGRIAGNVRVRFELTKEGWISRIRALDGPQALRAAAEHFIRDCAFLPYTEGGVPISVQSEVDVPFSLGEGQAAGPGTPLTGYVLRIRNGKGPVTPAALDQVIAEAQAMLARTGLKPVEPDKADPARTLDLTLELDGREMDDHLMFQSLRARISTLADRDQPVTAPGKPPRVWRFERSTVRKGGAPGTSFEMLLEFLGERLQPAYYPLPEPTSDGGAKQADFVFIQMRVKMQPPPPPYPPLAKVSGIQGTVVVELVVNPEGVPISAAALSGPIELTPAAVLYGLDWRFEPATLNGVPQTARFRLTMPFNLR